MNEAIEGQLVQVSYAAPALPALTATSVAKAVEIDSQEMYEYANAQLVLVKDQWTTFEKQRKAIVDPINTAKNAVQALFNPVLDDLAGAERVYKASMLTYQRELDQKRREEQAALDEAARKERERLEKMATKEAAKGHTEKAEVLHATAAVITAPIATSTYVAPKGLGTQKKWKGRITDKVKAIQALLARPEYLELLSIDEAGLNRLAVATKGALKLEGIECFEDEILTSRRAA
jgi:hypothetical protein